MKTITLVTCILVAALGQYFAPNLSLDEFQERVHNTGIDPLKAFSEACRRELMSMHAPV